MLKLRRFGFNLKKKDVQTMMAKILTLARKNWPTDLDTDHEQGWIESMAHTVRLMTSKVAKAERKKVVPRWLLQVRDDKSSQSSKGGTQVDEDDSGDGADDVDGNDGTDDGTDEDDDDNAEPPSASVPAEQPAPAAVLKKPAASQGEGATPPAAMASAGEDLIYGWDPCKRMMFRTHPKRPSQKEWSQRLVSPDDGSKYMLAEWKDGFRRQIFDVTVEEHETWEACQFEKRTGPLYTTKSEDGETTYTITKKQDTRNGLIFQVLVYPPELAECDKKFKQITQYTIGHDHDEQIRKDKLESLTGMLDRYVRGETSLEEFKDQVSAYKRKAKERVTSEPANKVPKVKPKVAASPKAKRKRADAEQTRDLAIVFSQVDDGDDFF